MPINVQRLGIFVLQETEVRIFFQRLGEIDQIAIRFRRQGCVRQPWTDRLSNIQRSRALGNILNAPIRKLHMNAVCHKLEPAGVLNLPVYWRDSGGSNFTSAICRKSRGWARSPTLRFKAAELLVYTSLICVAMYQTFPNESVTAELRSP